jgi:NTP pyrophosphatase (non-canonical NTP hydrolase)
MQQQAAAAGDEKAVERLGLLQQNLLPLTTFGKRVLKQQAAVASLKDLKGPEEFLDLLVASDQDEVSALTVAARPLMDYAFFQALSERIEAAQGPARERLTDLRTTLLKLTQELDEAAQATIQEGVDLLREIINSPNPRTLLRERADELSDVFMDVLAANIKQANERGDQALLARLQMVYEEIADMIEESYPPEIQLVNELMNQPYPEGTREMLLERREEFTPEVLDIMARMADEVARRDDPQSGEIAKRLRDVRAQAMLMV